MNNKRVLGIITARGGSKRIPRKNIKEFCGKPIIAYSIEAAKESGIFDEIMVSTEDREIAEIAKQYGAQVPFFRSEENAGDFVTTSDVIFEVAAEYKKLGQIFDTIVCIYPTAPFITGKRLKEALDVYENLGADSLVPVVKFSFPPQRAMEINNGLLEFRQPEYISTRSQDLKDWYHDAGQFYIINYDSFVEKKQIIAGRIAPFVLSELEVQDIDNIVDWQLAELKYKLINNGT